MFHVYQIVEKESRKPVYIGCSNNPRKRGYGHRSAGTLTDSRELIVVFSTPEKKLALSVERQLIQNNSVSNKSPSIVYRIGSQLFTRKQLASYLSCSMGTISNYLREGWNPKAEMYSFKTKRDYTVERIKR